MRLREFQLRVIVVVLALGCSVASAQEEFYHPELEWKTIETQHFFVHFHEGAERTARVVSKIAEEIYEPVTSFYQHKPSGKVSFIIKDYDDISNGAAYFYENKIEIFAPSMDFELRGTHNWLRNVITHEYTHIVQIQTSMKFGRAVPAFYFQWLGYEAERRPDVLYGYPNIIVSYPYSGFVVPAWFAEGVAQYNRREFEYDYWDSHRDMILRCYALDGNMLSWEQMGVFGKTSLGNESSYNAGFAFVRYLADSYGEGKLVEISRNLSQFGTVTIDAAIEKAIGKSGRTVYEEWSAGLRTSYAARVENIRKNLRQGQPLVIDTNAKVFDPGEIQVRESMLLPGEGRRSLPATVGFANLYPVFSPDGKKLAYTSAKGGDYFSLSSLFVYDFDTKKETLIKAGVRTSVSWSPDGRKLYYGKSTRDNPHWSFQFDIYEYDLAAEEEKRITSGKRALNPAVSPDGKRIACVVNRDGTTNLALVNVDGSGFAVITSYAQGEQVYNPTWSPDGSQILFDYSIKDGREIAAIKPDGTGLRFLIEGADDSRTAVFSPDGSRIYFSSDRSGIFNIYTYELATGRIDQITNVLGGAFYPTVNTKGELLYSAYTSGGYKIFQLPALPVIVEGDHHYKPLSEMEALSKSSSPPLAATGSTAQFDWQTLRTYDDTKLPDATPRQYKDIFSSLSFVPFVRIDNYNPKSKGIDIVKVGGYIFSNDILEKTGFFAGAAVNLLLETDLFLQFNYRGKIPLLYQLGLEPVASIELYDVTRKTENVISLPASTIPVDVGYNLFEFDFVLNQQFVSQFSDVEFRYIHSRYKSIIESFINPETTPPSLVPGSSDLYLIANDLALSFFSTSLVPSRTSAINPVGRKVKLRFDLEFNKFNGDGEYEVTSSGLRPVYKDVDFGRAEITWKEYFPFFFRNHTLTLKLRGATIFGPPVDEFFDFYLGGLVGMKGYPFYSLGGNELASVGLEYRFPLVNNLDFRFLPIYFDKLYAAVYADVGNAWTGISPRLSDFKTDVGFEIRLESWSYYAFPTRIFFNLAYGFQRFDKYVRSQDQTVTYGREWLFYFGVLFDFDLD